MKWIVLAIMIFLCAAFGICLFSNCPDCECCPNGCVCCIHCSCCGDPASGPCDCPQTGCRCCEHCSCHGGKPVDQPVKPTCPNCPRQPK